MNLKFTPEETLAINGSHDCSATFIDKNKEIRIYEYERLVKKRYAMFSSNSESNELMGTDDSQRRHFLTTIKSHLLNPDIKLVLWHDMNEPDIDLIKEYFPNATFVFANHHEAHAYGSHHLSKFNDCLIFSVDGGGNDYGAITSTNFYLYKDNKLQLLTTPNINFTRAYNGSAHILADIVVKKPGCLSLAGKLMGLSGYGNVREDWLDYFRDFYKVPDLSKLCEQVELENKPMYLDGQIAWDFAKTSQYVFEETLFAMVKPYIDEYKLDVIMTGGCALNVLFNQKLYEYLKTLNLNIFVPSIPNDSGLSYGMFVAYHKDVQKKEEVCFNGFEILDKNTYKNFENNPWETFSLTKLVEYLKDGKIIGILQNNSEVGPRALGNRSIICYPAIPNMKDIINNKVKFREWFRPFAPVCKLEDKDAFFNNAPDSKYMSYAPSVKNEWKSKLPSITHIDGTARLQTVEAGCLFYDILSEMKNLDLIPVLLNTSFNIKGYPILTTVEDAFFALNNTKLDLLLYDNKIYKKNN